MTTNTTTTSNCTTTNNSPSFKKEKTLPRRFSNDTPSQREGELQPAKTDLNSPSFKKGWRLKGDGVVEKSQPNHPICRDYKSLPANKNLKEKARELRKAGNLSEVLFWREVKNKKLLGLDFDRQKIIGNYIVDFFVKPLGLVVEIDGSSHDFKAQYDQEREDFLKSLGLKIYKILDIEVRRNLSDAIDGLEFFIRENWGG